MHPRLEYALVNLVSAMATVVKHPSVSRDAAQRSIIDEYHSDVQDLYNITDTVGDDGDTLVVPTDKDVKEAINQEHGKQNLFTYEPPVDDDLWQEFLDYKKSRDLDSSGGPEGQPFL